MCVYVCVYMCIYVYICVCMCVCVCIYVYICVCMCVCVCIYVYVCVSSLVYMQCYVQYIPETNPTPVNAIAYIQSSFLLTEESSGKQIQDIPYTAITSMEADIYSGEITLIYDMEGSKTYLRAKIMAMMTYNWCSHSIIINIFALESA